MQKNNASETAVHTAVRRAAHQILDEDPKILDDPLAVGFVPGSSEEEIRLREEEFKQAPGRSIFPLRSRFAEDQLAAAFRDGVRQYLILGAGFDTFAYRQPNWASKLNIIEVDHPASQQAKQDRLRQLSIAVPVNTSFCSVDFENTTLAAGLETSPFDPHLPVCISWLGVTQYLTRPAIEKTFEWVLSLPSLSRITFSFVLPPSSLEGSDQEKRIKIIQKYAKTDEPWHSLFDPDELLEWLVNLGFSHTNHLTPELAQERYFAGRKDSLRVPISEQIICAQV